MQTTLQRPSHQQHSQLLSSSLSGRHQTGSMAAASGHCSAGTSSGFQRLMVAEDSDDIDDILYSLWPTGATLMSGHRDNNRFDYKNNGTPNSLTASAFLQDNPVMQHRESADGTCFGCPRSRPPPPQSIPQFIQSLTPSGSPQYLNSGQRTPPEDVCARMSLPAVMLQSHQPVPPLYALASSPKQAAPILLHNQQHQKKQSEAMSHYTRANGGPLARSISSSIQIGDPEWRVDSPQSAVHASSMYMRSTIYNGHGKLPSPVSPTAPALVIQQDYHATQQTYPQDDVALMQLQRERAGAPMRPQPTTLGIGRGANVVRTSRSASMLGLMPRNGSGKPAASSSMRMLTPEERAARLHTVSGLAARAVARRCLSGQLPALDADVMLRQAGAAIGSMPGAEAAAAAAAKMHARKLTFADVARGTQEQEYHNGQLSQD
ncbi:hypothetical protein BX070DRAFT_11309 [Coemansia spiralis]|nr:hypothetical protein BX070DRAFT_11309 [Coemansia spiralis]